MIRRILPFAMAAIFAVGISSCREEAGDDMEDSVENAADEAEDEM